MIYLPLGSEKGYKRGVPICPRCNATIHTGAEDQCPACGYSIRRANEVFGDNQVEFTRVVDAAGVLRHQERLELLHMLEGLERKISPAALCIYITDDGQAQEFRTHAHWILNHARIHHPSFGKRQKKHTIEETELTENFGDKRRRPEDESPAGPMARMWQKLCTFVQDKLHPLPPPVRQEWMLILVLDVQLETACFSWGYMLDPYINPDAINSSILSAKLLFRERAMVAALKRVMREAVCIIASSSRKVNKERRRKALQGGSASMLLTAMALAGLGTHSLAAQEPARPLATAPIATEASATPPPAETAPSAAQGDAPASPELPPVPAPPPPPPPAPGRAASYDTPPLWAEDDYRHLMAGELIKCYTTLHTPVVEEEEGKEKKKARSAERRPKPTPRPRRTPRDKEAEESDTKVPSRYWPMYTKVAPSGLCDPQQLYSTAERNDIERTLREINTHSNFRIYATIFKAGQEVPQNLGANTLVTAAAQPCEYAVLIHYKTGDSPEIELGYLEIKPSDEQRHEWLQRVREAAAAQGGGVDGLLAAIRSIHTCIASISSGFRPITPETAAQAPLIHIELNKDETEDKDAKKKRKEELFFKYGIPSIATILLVVLFFVGKWLLRRWRSGQLYAHEPDFRLASPFGAGVSRLVRYLEGTEASKEKRLF